LTKLLAWVAKGVADSSLLAKTLQMALIASAEIWYCTDLPP